MAICEHEEGKTFTCPLAELHDRLDEETRVGWRLYDGWFVEEKNFYAWLKRTKR